MPVVIVYGKNKEILKKIVEKLKIFEFDCEIIDRKSVV